VLESGTARQCRFPWEGVVKVHVNSQMVRWSQLKKNLEIKIERLFCHDSACFTKTYFSMKIFRLYVNYSPSQSWPSGQ
jgi:hypothetical protein